MDGHEQGRRADGPPGRRGGGRGRAGTPGARRRPGRQCAAFRARHQADALDRRHQSRPADRTVPPEGVEAIHDGAMRILEEIGIEFLNPEAIEILRDAGCIVDGENVRMGRDLVMEMVGKAPAEFTLTPRNLDRKITIGGKHMVFGNISSPPNCSDIDRGRRSGNREDYRNFLR
jgi:trimethylamine--corrinoid protein Co-methyltransferase